MSHDPRENDPTADPPPLEGELVAYLDGELDAQAERRVEQLLATDPAIRNTLRELEHTWELLDDLGADDVDATFTRSTLEMAAVEAQEEVRQVEAELPRRRGWRLAAQVGGIGAAALAGFLAVAMIRPDPNRPLLEDLPVLENLDQYQQVGDIEFLRKLRDAHLFDKEAGDGG